jgi:hypothetical protein
MMSSTSEPHAASAVDHPLVLVWLAWFLRCLTAAWLATALMYALSVGTLPEPIVGLATAVALAGLIATALVAVELEQARALTHRPASTQTAAEGYEPPPLAPSRPPDAVRPAPPLDLSAYPSAQRGLRQCPRCGSFAVIASEDAEQQMNTCRTCSQVWRSGAGLPDPDVVVRSWLHR